MQGTGVAGRVCYRSKLMDRQICESYDSTSSSTSVIDVVISRNWSVVKRLLKLESCIMYIKVSIWLYWAVNKTYLMCICILSEVRASVYPTHESVINRSNGNRMATRPTRRGMNSDNLFRYIFKLCFFARIGNQTYSCIKGDKKWWRHHWPDYTKTWRQVSVPHNLSSLMDDYILCSGKLWRLYWINKDNVRDCTGKILSHSVDIRGQKSNTNNHARHFS
jgi:hypothetical protein